MESTKVEKPSGFAKMFESAMMITGQLAEHRRELCRLLIFDEETTYSEQIREIRKSILKYRSRPLSFEAKEVSEESRAKMEAFFSQMTPPSSIETTTMMMEMMSKPVEEHSRLLDKIATVIKSELPDDEKVEAISNLLL